MPVVVAAASLDRSGVTTGGVPGEGLIDSAGKVRACIGYASWLSTLTQPVIRAGWQDRYTAFSNVGRVWEYSELMDTDQGSGVPYRSKMLLEEWVKEFLEQGHSIAGQLNVVLQDGADGRDTGLVIVRLQNALADIYMQPRGIDDPLWEATLTARTADLTMTPYQLAGLAAEVVVSGNLCTFLQYKSLDWDRQAGQREA